MAVGNGVAVAVDNGVAIGDAATAGLGVTVAASVFSETTSGVGSGWPQTTSKNARPANRTWVYRVNGSAPAARVMGFRQSHHNTV